MSAQSIFITGASSGIGLASALKLHAHGFRVFAGILPGEDTTPLTSLHSERMQIIPIDITKSEMVTQASMTIQEATGTEGLYGLFNNAGVAIAGPIEFLPLELVRRQMEINFFGHVAITQALLPLIRKARGRIVNTVSMLGKFVVGFNGPYSMSKYAMEAFTDTLRLELAPLGVQVSALEPGVIKTPIWTKVVTSADEIIDELPPEAKALYGEAFTQTMKLSRKSANAGISPEAVARAALHAFTAHKPRTRYPVGHDARLVTFLRRVLSDRLFDRIIITRNTFLVSR